MHIYLNAYSSFIQWPWFTYGNAGLICWWIPLYSFTRLQTLTSTHLVFRYYNHHYGPDQLTVMTNVQADQSYLKESLQLLNGL